MVYSPQGMVKTVIMLGLLANPIGGVGQSPVVDANADLSGGFHAKVSVSIKAEHGAKARCKAEMKGAVPSRKAAKKEAEAKIAKRKSMENLINIGNKNVRSGAWSLLGDLAW